MTDLLKLADNLSKVDINAFIVDVLRLPAVREEIPEIVKDRLYNTGQDCFGNELRTDSAKDQGNRSYAGFTYQEKRRKGQRARNVTLRDTGGFYESINAQVPFKTLKISANFRVDDGHIYDNFKTSYSSEADFETSVLGLSEQDIERLGKEFIMPNLQARINRLINV